jgi:hypothetical protein
LEQEELLVLPQPPQLVAAELVEQEEIPHLGLSFVSVVEAALQTLLEQQMVAAVF